MRARVRPPGPAPTIAIFGAGILMRDVWWFELSCVYLLVEYDVFETFEHRVSEELSSR